MGTTAIIMMSMFIIIIWGGLVLSGLALRKTTDEHSGDFGSSRYATDTLLIEQELERP